MAAILTYLIVGSHQPRHAWAEKPSAKAAQIHHTRGLKHYNVGRFAEAIVEFERAYDLDPHPTLLFNLAKAHYRQGALEKASFFFKRYVQMAPNAKDRASAEEQIRAIEDQLGASTPVEAPATPQPAQTGQSPLSSAPSSAAIYAPPPVPPSPAEVEPLSTKDAAPVPPPDQGSVARAAVHLGGALPFTGGRSDIGNPLLFTAALSLAFPIPTQALSLDLGGIGSYTLLPYETRTGATRRSTLVSLLANLALRFSRGDLDLAPSLGIGATWWTGLGPGNSFTSGGVEATGAVVNPTVRLGMDAFWNLRPRVFLGLSASCEVSRMLNRELADVVPTLTRLGLTAAFGLRL